MSVSSNSNKLSPLMLQALKILSYGKVEGLVLPQWIIWHVHGSGEIISHIKTATIHALERRGLVSVNRLNRYRYVAIITDAGHSIID